MSTDQKIALAFILGVLFGIFADQLPMGGCHGNHPLQDAASNCEENE